MEVVQPLLVVEDEALIRINLIDVLNEGGYTVDECASGNAAIANIDSRDVLHGLITDINIGSGPNGWHVARQARQKFPDIAVVYISGDSVDAWTAEGVPNSLILQKPFADAQLLSAVTTLLGAVGPQPGPSDLKNS
jgi:CheY-like chemotaxis protein